MRPLADQEKEGTNPVWCVKKKDFSSATPWLCQSKEVRAACRRWIRVRFLTHAVGDQEGVKAASAERKIERKFAMGDGSCVQKVAKGNSGRARSSARLRVKLKT
mmetsp:Transcript_45735/g.90079  ORF Transcript_45735/g.90079 Transcript_45735/m.90079 type:complete len:104 (+) Transcript_45735:2190-2501(+)